MQLLTTQMNLYHAVKTYIVVKVNTLASCIELWIRCLLRASVSVTPEEQSRLYILPNPLGPVCDPKPAWLWRNIPPLPEFERRL